MRSAGDARRVSVHSADAPVSLAVSGLRVNMPDPSVQMVPEMIPSGGLTVHTILASKIGGAIPTKEVPAMPLCAQSVPAVAETGRT